MKPIPRSGFTIIELLVAIGVIAILAAFLIPAVGSARASANAAKTASNLRQIGAGISLYANDHNGEFPNNNGDISDVKVSGTDRGAQWREAIHRYISGSIRPGSIYNFSNGADREIWRAGNAGEPDGHRLNHFGVNVFMNFHKKFKINRIPDPARYVLIGEINHDKHAIDPRVSPDYTGKDVTQYRISHPGETAFYLFADGHVEGLSGPRLPNEYPEMWDY